MDTDNHGYLQTVNFEEYFAEDEDLIGYNFGNLIKYWSRYEEDKLTYGDFNNGIAPYSGSASMSGQGGYGSYGASAGRYQPYQPYPRHRDEDQKNSQEKSWRSQLKLVIYLTGRVASKQLGAEGGDQEGEEAEQPEPTPPVMTHEEASSLWQDIDNYNYGYISTHLLQRWLEDQAQFTLPHSDVHYLYDAFETKEQVGRITDEQFMKVLGGPPEEEGQEGEGEAEMEAPENE